MRYDEWLQHGHAVSVRIEDPQANRIILPGCQLKCLKELNAEGKEIIVENINALVDTGATISAIDENLAKRMNLVPTGKAVVSGVHGAKVVDTYTFDFRVGGLVVLMKNASCGQFDGQGFQLLLGMDVLRLGEFYLGTFQDRDGREKTMFSFSVPSQAKGFDFVAEWNSARERKEREGRIIRGQHMNPKKHRH